MSAEPVATPVYDTYWRFAAERQRMHMARLRDPVGPWTDDPILAEHRFTNVFRASDRVSQRLIRDIQYGAHRSQEPAEVYFRTILFKTFNSEGTWDALESELGTISWQSFDAAAASAALERRISSGISIYSAAYIMPAPPMGRVRKHDNHLAQILWTMDQSYPSRIEAAASLEQVYRLLAAVPGNGRFLAFQYAIDLNYSTLIDFDEDDFVVAGPGAVDGLSKCFSDDLGMSPEQLIRWISSRMEIDVPRLAPGFDGLHGRMPKLIDLQNLCCEISKYARVAHPEHPGVAGRTRIKQRYSAPAASLPDPFYPPKWGISPPRAAAMPPPAQTDLFP